MFKFAHCIVAIKSLLLLTAIHSMAEERSVKPLQTVAAVDLSRYTGLWHEIAKIPNSFQRQCVRGTTAEYQTLSDGRIRVINRCIKHDGSMASATGIARVVDTTSCAKLKVSFVSLFGIRLFWGDYWIIGLDEAYQWAIVGTPSRKYGWILSRSPQMSEATLLQLYRILRANGYDPADFVPTNS